MSRPTWMSIPLRDISVPTIAESGARKRRAARSACQRLIAPDFSCVAFSSHEPPLPNMRKRSMNRRTPFSRCSTCTNRRLHASPDKTIRYGCHSDQFGTPVCRIYFDYTASKIRTPPCLDYAPASPDRTKYSTASELSCGNCEYYQSNTGHVAADDGAYHPDLHCRLTNDSIDPVQLACSSFLPSTITQTQAGEILRSRIKTLKRKLHETRIELRLSKKGLIGKP